MGLPIGNGLVEIRGANKETDWFCMDLVNFLSGSDWDTYDLAFQEAKSGNCPFKNICDRFKRTSVKSVYQLNLFKIE